MPEQHDRAAAPSVRRSEVRHRARVVVAVVAVAIVLALALDNTKSTRIGYVFGGLRAPLIVVLLIAVVLGAAIEWLLLHRPERLRHHRGSRGEPAN